MLVVSREPAAFRLLGPREASQAWHLETVSNGWEAMERMQSEAQTLSAEGIVGVDLQEKSHGWGSHTIEFFAVGTAIVPREGHTEEIEAPTTVLDLS